MKLVEGFDSNYRYVLVAARRARQIQNGARPALNPFAQTLPHCGRRNPGGQSEMGDPDAGKCGFAGSDCRRSKRKGWRRGRRLNFTPGAPLLRRFAPGSTFSSINTRSRSGPSCTVHRWCPMSVRRADVYPQPLSHWRESSVQSKSLPRRYPGKPSSP